MNQPQRLVLAMLLLVSSTGCTSLGGAAGPFMGSSKAAHAPTRGSLPFVTGGEPDRWVLPNDRGRPIDVQAENEPAERWLASLGDEALDVPTQLIIVPGFSTKETEGLHARARTRLEEALRTLRRTNAPAILVSGGNVRPAATPYNEAMEMKRYLLSKGLGEHRILVDPHARHSTTNLRNAGRFMRSKGLDRALVVSTRSQSFYFGWPVISSFHLRCLFQLGYLVGSLTSEGPMHTRFEPSEAVWTPGSDPRDP